MHSVLGISLLASPPTSCAFRIAWGVADLLVNFLLGFGLITHSPS